MDVLDVCNSVKVEDLGEMMLMLLLVFHYLIMFTIEIYLVNMEPFLQLQTGLTVYTKMLGLDSSLGEQQQGRYMIVFHISFLWRSASLYSFSSASILDLVLININVILVNHFWFEGCGLVMLILYYLFPVTYL